MKTKFSRRNFLIKSSEFSIACCAFAICPKLSAMGGFLLKDGEVPDPKKLNYCGYTCPPDCQMHKATLENDIDLKKEAYKLWRIEEKYGVEFDPEQVFCYGCKTSNKPLGIVVEKCPVRHCAIEKGYDCCIQCNELTDCELELWKAFPDFYKSVIEMQKKYLMSKSKE